MSVTLEDILQKHFGCKKPFYKAPKIRATDYETDKDYLTKSGSKAYGKLTSLIFDLGIYFDETKEAQELVDLLDEIVSDEQY